MYWILLIFVSVVLLIIKPAKCYVASVVEHNIYLGKEGENPETLLSENLNIYERAIQLAESHNVQVIVFPEFGLTAVKNASTREDLYPFAEQIPIVDASHPIAPCGNASYASSSILYRMSCAAKESGMLTLVNTIDWVNCNPASDSACPSDNHYQYNTDILFDEQGVLVAKYHKSHEWPTFLGVYDQPAEPSEVSYLSNFGVEFGLFICFDIVFEDPPKVLRSRGISHFLYAVAQGKIGLETLITDWSKQQSATVLAANLGAGVTGDCSGILVNGTQLGGGKYSLGPAFPAGENILVINVPE